MSVDSKNQLGATALALAVANNLFLIVKALLRAGANPNMACDTGSGSIPLNLAAAKEVTFTLQALLDAKADPNLPNAVTGALPLNLAAAYGTTNGIRALLAAKADPNGVNRKNGNTALINAAIEGQIENALVLLNHGIKNIDQVSNSGQSALDFALENKHIAIVALLLDRGATLTNFYVFRTLLAAEPRQSCDVYRALTRILENDKKHSIPLSPVELVRLASYNEKLTLLYKTRIKLLAYIVKELLPQAANLSLPLITLVMEYDDRNLFPPTATAITFFDPKSVDPAIKEVQQAVDDMGRVSLSSKPFLVSATISNGASSASGPKHKCVVM